MNATIIGRKVPVGQIVMTPGSLAKLPRGEAIKALLRHMSGDWGDLDEHDWTENELAMEHGFRLFSRYAASNGTRFWIITEHDRSITTILLPSEY
jgi:hypothetical protein